jgi:hypothetical protein
VFEEAPNPATMNAPNPVDRAYNEYLDSLTGTERVERSIAMLNSVVGMLRHQVRRETPGIGDQELNLRVAGILYLSDPETQRLLCMWGERGTAR